MIESIPPRKRSRVTSERKIKANRANASSSTGPKTRYGRIRSARNALRHGLSLPIRVNPILAKKRVVWQVKSLDRMPACTSRRLRIASPSEIELRRVRTARQRFLSKRLSDSHYRLQKEQIGLRQRGAPAISTSAATKLARHPLAGPMKPAGIVLWETESILRMDRYERRARSRLRMAI